MEEGTDLFTCGICYEPYDEYKKKSKLLECHHTYCLSCLEQMYERQEKKKVVCPTCSVTTRPGKMGVAGLSANHYLNKFSDVLKQSTEHERIYEMGCAKHGETVGLLWCETCKVVVCKKCQANEHTISRGHVIINTASAVVELRKEVLELLSCLKNSMSVFGRERDAMKISLQNTDGKVQSATQSAIQGPYVAMCSRISNLDARVNKQILDLGNVDFTDPTVDLQQWNDIHKKLSDLMTSVNDYGPFVEKLKADFSILMGSDVVISFLPPKASSSKPGLFCQECGNTCRPTECPGTAKCVRCGAISYRTVPNSN